MTRNWTLEPLATMNRLTTLKFNNCTLGSWCGVSKITRLDALSITHCRVVDDDIFDLIPNQLAFLELKLISFRLTGKRWTDFIKRLKESNPWMEILGMMWK